MSIQGVVKGLSLYIGLLGGLIGCTGLVEETREGTTPMHSAPPVMEKAFASKVISPGDPWKVYIKASDQDGDMRMFILDFQRPGWPTSPYYLGIGKGERRRLSGYLILYTSNVPNLDDLISLDAELTVIIQDRAENSSQPVAFPLTFDYRAKAEEPEAGTFEEVSLGMIPVIELWQDLGPDDQEIFEKRRK